MSSPTETQINPAATERGKQAWAQTRLMIGALAIIVALHLIAQIVVAYDGPLQRARLAKWKAINGQFPDNRFYDDRDGTTAILCDDLPKADFSRGGVHFFGASRLSYALALWELPPAERPLMGNYCMGGTSHAEQAQMMRYLVDKRGLLQAGAEKTLVVFDLTISCAEHQITLDEGTPPGLFRQQLTRYNLYKYDPQTGIDDTTQSMALRRLRILYAHDDAFWYWLKLMVTGGNPAGVNAPPKIAMPTSDPIDPDWRTGMEIEIAELGRGIDYLQARGAHVAGIHLPQRSWQDHSEKSKCYRQHVFAMLRSKSVPFLDLAHTAPDSDFFDSGHLNYVGIQRVRPKIMKLAEDFLRSTGALPASTTQP